MRITTKCLFFKFNQYLCGDSLILYCKEHPNENIKKTT